MKNFNLTRNITFHEYAGKILSSGFIHIDNRQPSESQIKAGRGARWSY